MVALSVAQKVAIWLIPVLFAITVHEVAHGWVARQLGDPTASRLGRLTLNPVRHIDPIGTLVVPLLSVLISGFVFGWAKPIPVTWGNLRNPKRDMTLVALAGPLSNLCMALGWALVLKVTVLYYEAMAWVTEPLILMGIAGVFVNSILLVLNLVPLPPLDGGRVVTGLLPGKLAWHFARLERFGLLILLALLVTGLLQAVIGPVIYVCLWLLSGVGGVSVETINQGIILLT